MTCAIEPPQMNNLQGNKKKNQKIFVTKWPLTGGNTSEFRIQYNY